MKPMQIHFLNNKDPKSNVNPHHSSPGIPQDVSTITHSTTPVAKEYIQLTLTGESGPNADNKLPMAIVDFIHGCGLPFSVTDHPKFRKVTTLAKAVGSNHEIPSCCRIATDLLEINYNTYQDNSDCVWFKFLW
jgi:hypothetical protein